MKMREYILVPCCCLILSLIGCGTGSSSHSSSSSSVPSLDDSNFEEETSSGIVMVDFWAPWCGPCRTQGPIIDQVARDVEGKAKVYKLDVDQATDTAGRLDVRKIPTVMIFKDGQPVKRFVGVTGADELKRALAQLD